MENTLIVELGEPSVVAISAPGETRWGHYQFPHIARMEDGRLIVSYSVEADSAISNGAARPVCVSEDGGRTWSSAAPDEAEASAAGGIVFPDGEAIKFPLEKPLDAATLKLPPNPVRHRDLYSRESDCYRLGDLPEEVQRVKLLCRLPGEKEWLEEWAKLDIPDYIVQVFRREHSDIGWSDPNILVQPHIATEFFHTITPDGGLLNLMHLRRFNPDGTLPERGGVGVLRSDDRGRTWRVWGIPGWFRDEAEQRAAAQQFLDDPDSNYNRLWGGKDAAPIPYFKVGGLYEPGVVSFGDGRMVCVMRTDTGGTHEPCYVTRSADWGKTWTTPEILTPFGVMPKLELLDNGVIALVYGRPGVQLLFCTDGKGETWHTPVNLLPEASEKTRAVAASWDPTNTIRNRTNPIDDTCGNCTVLKTGPDRLLVAYSDFRHRDADGQLRKAICVREVKISEKGNMNMKSTTANEATVGASISTHSAVGPVSSGRSITPGSGDGHAAPGPHGGPFVLRAMLRDGKVLLGLQNTYPAAGIIEGMCRGWDFVWIDGQHGQHTQDSLLQAVRTADFMGVFSLVRATGQSADNLGTIADIRPSGIIIPMVDNAREAEAVSQALHFPPLGRRSYGGRRVIDLGGRDYYKEAAPMVIAQIETPDAVKDAEAVANVEGIDALFFGPDDMKIRLGLPVDAPIEESKELRAAMSSVAAAALRAGKHAACPASTVGAFNLAVDIGYRILPIGSDIGFLRTVAQGKLAEMRPLANRVGEEKR